MDYEARIGLTREKIRILSVFVRKILQVRTLKFPVLKVLDKLETLFPDNFYYVSEEDSLFEKNVPAYIEQEGPFSRSAPKLLTKEMMTKYKKFFKGLKP